MAEAAAKSELVPDTLAGVVDGHDPHVDPADRGGEMGRHVGTGHCIYIGSQMTVP